MSFGSETGRTRSGTKSFSSKEKKQKKKKQEFHSHRRAHFQESESFNPEELRARTVLTLDRLGHQILSTETGGYDLDAWKRNLDSLLDDFQDKLGAEKISEEFRSRRQEAMSSLVPSAASRDIDSEIQKLLDEEEAAKSVLDDAQRRSSERLVTLRNERDASAKELKEQKEKLAAIVEARQSRQFFSRILKSGPSTEETEAKIKELESKLKAIEEDIERSRKARSSAGGASGAADPAYLEAKEKLDAVQSKLLELQSARRDVVQLMREREIATKMISDAISSMKPDDSASTEAGRQPE